MSSTIKIRRNTAAAAAASNPVLAAGELGYETDTGRGKMGDGSTAWNALPYLDRHALAAAIPKSLIDAKGDLIVGTANDTVGRIAAPANGRRLVADSAQATGWRATGVGEYEGTGSPQGVVAAPVGSVYVDTAATSGALVWRKWTGTGASGWRPEEADTGWRDIASLSTSDWEPHPTLGRLHISRVNRVVTVIARLARASGAAAVSRSAQSAIVASLPPGFRQAPSAFAPMGVGSTSGSGIVLIGGPASSFDLTAYNGTGTWAAGDTLSFQITYLTVDAWPATLPGTPA